MKNQTLVFVVAGYKGIGLGHAYRVLDLYRSIHGLNKTIICTQDSYRAYSLFKRNKVAHVLLVRKNEKIFDLIDKIQPLAIINDVLNTERDYIERLKSCQARVINFEDLGAGGDSADLTINAIYQGASSDKMLYGHEYMDLRDEFVVARRGRVNQSVKNILITFGGEDSNNLTERVLRLVAKCELLRKKTYQILVGPAYGYQDSIRKFIQQAALKAEIISTSAPAEQMLKADMAISSNGRTPFELAALGVPAVVISANARETSHRFHEQASFIHCGLDHEIGDEEIADKIRQLSESFDRRQKIRERLDGLDLGNSKRRLLDKIHHAIYQPTAEAA
ncbi:PseG/SpsG family protein [Rugamonas sp. CCM 8940]|uniref:PseG/SpsG family protein n=1 Tax=Rugamonas sp. CCM 8940 TaxID=2765359 RepID=UPI0018F56126|nr:glycosyltransferase [Rugamonas sp. CCM 8940]MBJ7311215.1 hypothetical protein [Rugamonas sp. CCM 8940]